MTIYRCPSCLSSAIGTRKETAQEAAVFDTAPATLFFCKECEWSGGLLSLQVFCSDQDDTQPETIWVKDHMTHTVQLSVAEQKALMDELVTMLTSDTLALEPATIEFLESMVDRLSASIIQCSNMEIAYEQILATERGEG